AHYNTVQPVAEVQSPHAGGRSCVRPGKASIGTAQHAHAVRGCEGGVHGGHGDVGDGLARADPTGHGGPIGATIGGAAYGSGTGAHQAQRIVGEGHTVQGAQGARVGGGESAETILGHMQAATAAHHDPALIVPHV